MKSQLALSQVLFLWFFSKFSGFLLLICEQTRKSEDKTNRSIFILSNMSFKVTLKRFRRLFSRYRSSPSEFFLRKGVEKICSKCTEEYPCQSVISIELLCNFIEIALRHGCSVNLLHISEHLYLGAPVGGCFLIWKKERIKFKIYFVWWRKFWWFIMKICNCTECFPHENIALYIQRLKELRNCNRKLFLCPPQK